MHEKPGYSAPGLAAWAVPAEAVTVRVFCHRKTMVEPPELVQHRTGQPGRHGIGLTPTASPIVGF